MYLKEYLEKKDDLSVETLDVKNFLFGKTVTISEEPEMGQEWKEKIAVADAVIFVSPEYNHSFPGELKILIDSLYDEYKGKVAAICGVSMGVFGGSRMIENLKLVLHTVNFELALRTINVGKVQDAFTEEGQVTEEYKDKIEKMINGVVEELKAKVSK